MPVNLLLKLIFLKEKQYNLFWVKQFYKHEESNEFIAILIEYDIKKVQIFSKTIWVKEALIIHEGKKLIKLKLLFQMF